MVKMKRGMSVKCIDNHFVDEKTNPFEMGWLNLPKKGETYTIRNIIDTSYGCGVRLKEITNTKYYFRNIKRYEEPIFSLRHFEILQ